MPRANERLDQLERNIEELKSRSNPTRSNPVQSAPAVAQTAPSGGRAERSAQRTLEKVLDAVDSALTELDEGREEEAYEILNELLDED